MISTLLWVFFGTFVVYWLWFKKNGKKKEGKEIPGPRGLPLLGNLFQLGKKMHLTFNKWTEEFGDIYKVKFGPQVNIVISNPKMLKEIFTNDPNYVGRPQFDGFEMYEGERRGLVNTEGELWEVHRRFLLRQLRDFGFGKSSMQALIMEEVDEVISRFKQSNGRPITDIKNTLSLAVINSLWMVVGGQRFAHDDPNLTKLFIASGKLLEDVMEGSGVMLMVPFVRKIMPERSGYNKFRGMIEGNKKWFEGMVDEHKRTLQEDNVRDFIDVYLLEVKKTTDPNSVFYGVNAEKQLIATLADLFFAGSDTTSSTLAWAIMFLCKYPEAQRKLQDEIKTVTNDSRHVLVTDRSDMPYTLALIDEIFRKSSIAPNGVQHRALESKVFNGYYIEKNSWISPNLHFVHNDPKLWGDPENFRPERFLSEDGKKHLKNENLLPFQVGKRQCVGETLARDTIFLFLTNIFQRFQISFDPNSPEPTFEPKVGIILNPQNYSVIMKDRM